jgi:Escherichia/Staphylococcus phage prohead protease
MSNIDRRFVVGAELRTDAKAGAFTITARAVKYFALSEPNIPVAGGRETIARGAFSDSLASGSDVLALYQHDQNQPPLGRLKNGSLSIQDTDDGLYFTVRLNPAVQYHKDIHALVKDGSIDACSFAFIVNPDGDKWTNERDERGQTYILRTVRSAKLLDCSLVLTPAYGNGATTAQARNISYRFRTAQAQRQLSYEERFPAAGEYMLNRYRAARQAVEIRHAEMLAANSWGALQEKANRQAFEIEMEEYLREL